MIRTMTKLAMLKTGAAMIAAAFVASGHALAGVDMDAVSALATKPIVSTIGPNGVEAGVSQDGSPRLVVTLPNGFRYVIVNDICANGVCDRLGFLVVFTPAAGDFSTDTLNEWNSTRPPQAFKTPEGATVLVHYVLARGGIPAPTLEQNFEFWNNSIIAFDNFLSNSPKGVTVSVSQEVPSLRHSLDQVNFSHAKDYANDANMQLALPD